MDELQPTEGRVWRAPREKGITVKLPSGNVARIRPVGMDLVVRVGYIPGVLANTIVGMIETGHGEPPTSADLEEEKEWFRFLDCLCELAFVAPRIVKEPQADDEISIDDVELQDKMAIWRVLGAPARALVDYFQRQAQPVEAVANAEVHPSTGESDSGSAGLADGDHGR